MANIELQNVFIEKILCGPILLYLYVLYHQSSILQQLADDWQHFKVHSLVKKHQDTAFNKLHAIRTNTNVLVQFDFSENALITEQDEVQGAHWWHLQVSLFTACAWVSEDIIPFTIVSDYMNHDKFFTTVAIIKILKELLKKYIPLTPSTFSLMAPLSI